ncbi:hypothetical protein ACQF36_35895 [Streptomyces sp. Marseille-Q5077]|uniref:hypothetical protein n=1 Tax=Streptomyces sp. Marseille-Q5077 TaxID=3418995 RepID=UPI003D041A4B
MDLRALDAAASVTEDRAKQHVSSLAIRGFYPSLYLNLAAGLSQARRHHAGPHARGPRLARLDARNDDGYGQGHSVGDAAARGQLAEEDPSTLKGAHAK